MTSICVFTCVHICVCVRVCVFVCVCSRVNICVCFMWGVGVLSGRVRSCGITLSLLYGNKGNKQLAVNILTVVIV